ncbi:MAG: Calx-beta domain-containing protein, partial [Acidimicrobiales bacterium]
MTTAPRAVAAHAGDDCVLFAPADVEENDWFGSSVGIDGDTAVLTSWIAEEDGPTDPLNAGAAYVYDRQPDGSWLEGQKLLPSNPGVAFNFGFSADIDGDIIAIGAWHEKVGNAAQAGAVYIFERPTPTGVWTETARLTASDADVADDFGYNLEVDAATSSVIVGAHKEDEGGLDSGAAYVFRKDVNDVWIQEAKLLDPNAAPNDRQGNDVAISGDWAVVGHHLDDNGINGFQSNAGGALLYKRTGTTWGAPIELDGSDPEPVKNRAGYGVDVDGDLLVMTSYHDFDDRLPQAWIFRENNGIWTEEQHIYPYPSVNSGDHPDAGANNNDGTHFGRHVEVDNGVIAIGSSYDATLDFERGATHYWTQDTNGLWVETARIDPEGNAKYFHAGIAVALSATHAVIGAEKGNLNDDGIHEPFQTSPSEVFNSGLACIAELSNILDGTHSPNPFYGVYASVGDATLDPEGDDGVTAQVGVDVTLSQPASATVTVEVSTADGSASVGDSDYTPVTAQTVTFAPGDVSETVFFDVVGDFRTEANETFQVELSNPTTGVLIEDGVGQVTIIDDDVLTVSVGDATIVEGDSGNTAVLVDLTLPYPTPATVSADVATSDGSATTADNDYVAHTETVTFNPGDQTKQVSIDIVGDSFIESDETFTLNLLSTTAGLSILDGIGEITITGDDANLVSIGDATVAEGADGATPTVSVDVTLSEPAATAIDVTVSSADGTATLADGDYQSSSQVVSFAVSESTKSVTLTIVGDDEAEADEVFNAVLSNPSAGVTIGDGIGDITITNDDSVALSVGDAATLEGALGATTPVSVEISLSSPAITPVSVTVDTADGTATTADSDYTAVAAQTVSFATGEQTKTVSIDVIGDDVSETNEAFTLVASAPSAGLTIADSSGTIDIFEDDSIAVVVSDASVTEGAAATTDTVDVTVSLTQAAVAPVDVTIATADDSATTADSDYVAVASQLVSFAIGESSKIVTLTVNGDDAAEADEVFLVQASNPTGGATIADGTGEVTIVNDDSLTVSIADGSTLEGDAGSAPLVLDVTLSQAAVEPVTVEVSTTDGSATTADSDYVAVASQIITFGVGETTKQVSIIVNGDEQFETNEDFTVNLANPSAGLSIADGSATATITNDEDIVVSVADASVVEGDSPTTTTVSVDVSLSDPADGVMTVLINTADGTATAGSDYVAPAQQTVTFQQGESLKTVDITVNGDDLIELAETFSVIASAPTGGLLLGDDTG